MRKQSIRRGVWRIGGRQRQQTEGFFPKGALAEPITGRIASNLIGLLLKKIVGRKRRRRGR